MSWERGLEGMLCDGLRYCFLPIDGKYPEIDKLGLYGDVRDAGFLDFMRNEIRSWVKRAFIEGYVLGAKASYEDCVKFMEGSDGFFKPLVFDEFMSRGGAEEAWAKEEVPMVEVKNV